MATNKAQEDLLPDGAGPSDDDIDISDLRVNFSDEEASSEARDYTPLPSGKYPVNVTDIDLRKAGPDSKNPGKPYWNLEMTISEGQYVGRKLWANVMLFEGALYSLSQLCKATGHEEVIKTGKIPPMDVFRGAQMVVSVVKQKDQYAMKDAAPGEPPIYKNEVKGFKAPTSLATTGEGSLMP